MSFVKTILSFLFPEKCFSCGKKDVVLCGECALNLPRGFSPDQKTLVLLDYGDKRVKKAIWLFKYKNKRALAEIFAGLIRDMILEEISELRLMKNFVKPLLIPMPVSAKRFRERGYNQTELVAREIIKLGGDETLELGVNILLKNKNTPPQVKTASKRERLKNIRGSFSVPNEIFVRGRNVILLDDVITTGATMSEARSALKKAGVKNILCAALAH